MENLPKPALKLRVRGNPVVERYGFAVEYFARYLPEDLPPHFIDVVLLTVIVRGRGKHLLGDDLHDETSGCVSITHYGQSHKLIPDADGIDCFNVYIDLQDHALPILPDSLQPTLAAILPVHPHLRHELNRSVRIRVNNVDDLVPHLRRIEREMKSHRPGAAEIMRYNFQLFLIDLCRAAQANGVAPMFSAARHTLPDWVERIRQQLDRDFAEEHNLPKLAARAGTSATYLCHAFKRYTGKTVFTYLAERRVQAAMWRLRNGDEKVLAIALDCGFTDVNYFNRVFKRIVGRTPTAYRERS